MTTPRDGSAIEDWFARAQRAPEQARRDWRERGAALLPLGDRFNAVRLPARLVYAAVGTDDLDLVAATLAELLDGPVIHNRPDHTYFALVQPEPPARWAYGQDAPMLGPNHFLSIPATDLRGPTGLYWTVLPRIVGDLCAVQSVASLIHIARSELLRRRG